MRVLVCGGRDYRWPDNLASVLDRLHGKYHFTHLMQGGAPGADIMAEVWARTKPEIECHVRHADWKFYGRKAGPIRNAKMLEWKPDLVVAFPGGVGTADMVSKAKAAGVRVIEVK